MEPQKQFKKSKLLIFFSVILGIIVPIMGCVGMVLSVLLEFEKFTLEGVTLLIVPFVSSLFIIFSKKEIYYKIAKYCFVGFWLAGLIFNIIR